MHLNNQKNMEKKNTISSNAYEILKSYLGKDREVLDLYVKNKWLTAELSNMSFSVRNK